MTPKEGTIRRDEERGKGTKITCTHCGRAFPPEKVKKLEALGDVSCCDDCADIFREGKPVFQCEECQGNYRSELRRSFPKGLQGRLQEIVSTLDQAAAVVVQALQDLENFEGEHAILQLLDGGAAEEAERALLRIYEKAYLVGQGFETVADLYRPFLENER